MGAGDCAEGSGGGDPAGWRAAGSGVGVEFDGNGGRREPGAGAAAAGVEVPAPAGRVGSSVGGVHVVAAPPEPVADEPGCGFAPIASDVLAFLPRAAEGGVRGARCEGCLVVVAAVFVTPRTAETTVATGSVSTFPKAPPRPMCSPSGGRSTSGAAVTLMGFESAPLPVLGDASGGRASGGLMKT